MSANAQFGRGNPMFAVVYRTGGVYSCKWNRVLENYSTRDEALVKAQEIERMGYKTIIHKHSTLDIMGLPVGWKHHLVDWERDTIKIDRFTTLHVKAY